MYCTCKVYLIVGRLRKHYSFFTVSGEADLVSHHVTSLVSSGVSGKDIAVIAPYNLQVSDRGRGRGGKGIEVEREDFTVVPRDAWFSVQVGE